MSRRDGEKLGAMSVDDFIALAQEARTITPEQAARVARLLASLP